jgi:hypothetical protein
LRGFGGVSGCRRTLAQDHNIHAPILAAPLSRAIAGSRMILGIAGSAEMIGVESVSDDQ